jgi:hypothetical protein
MGDIRHLRYGPEYHPQWYLSDISFDILPDIWDGYPDFPDIRPSQDIWLHIEVFLKLMW